MSARRLAQTVSLLLLLRGLSDAETLTFDFASGDFNWTAGFADYPSDADPDFYELQSGFRSRPDNLGVGGSIFISGSNHSDDLFMFIKKSVPALAPNTLYSVTFRVALASKYAVGSGGIGGSPADSVYLKAGASRFEPDRVVDGDGWYRMNLDKGNQANEGSGALILGTIGKPDDGTANYALIERTNTGRPLNVWTSASGELWLIVGTDSGFEGTTSLYYTKIIAELEVTNPLRIAREEQMIKLEWTAGVLQRAASPLGEWADLPGAMSPLRENVTTEARKFWRVRSN